MEQNMETNIISRFGSLLWHEAMDRNTANILALLEKNPFACVLDVGCGDGKETVLYKNVVCCSTIGGVDGQPGRVKAARNRGVDAIVANIEKKWPYPNKSLDVVITNQVVEHVLSIDHFIEETYRVLKPGGYSIVSTENLASWHNIGALILGYQDFSHHIIKYKHVGNPFSMHYGEKTATWSKKDHSGVDDSAYPHIKIMTYRSLKEVYETYGFRFEKGLGSGYYPLFGLVASMVSRTDPFHSHFITEKFRKD